MASTTDTPATPATPAEPAFKLVVIHPFAKYRRGAAITDAAAIAAVLAGPNAHHCNRVAN